LFQDYKLKRYGKNESAAAIESRLDETPTI